jgi:hypothetical protein
MDRTSSMRPVGPVVLMVLFGLLIGMDVDGIGGALALGLVCLATGLLSLLVRQPQ